MQHPLEIGDAEGDAHIIGSPLEAGGSKGLDAVQGGGVQCRVGGHEGMLCKEGVQESRAGRCGNAGGGQENGPLQGGGQVRRLVHSHLSSESSPYPLRMLSMSSMVVLAALREFTATASSRVADALIAAPRLDCEARV